LIALLSGGTSILPLASCYRAAAHAALCGPYAAPRVAHDDQCAAASQQFRPQHLTPSAPWLALQTPMQLPIPEGKKRFYAKFNSISIFSLMSNLPFNLFTHGRPAGLLLLDIETRFLLIRINKVQKSGTVESKNCWIFG
jgi:hypothetical protein